MTIEWPVIALGVDLSEQPSPAERAGRFILLSFSNKDCARFYDCLGDHFNIQFLSDCVRYIVGAPGDLVGPDGEHQDTRETVEALTASNKSLVYFYNLANPTKSVSKTFIPSTELSEPTSSGSQSPSSASSSTDTSEAPSMLSGRTLNDLGLDLGPFSDMEFSRGSKRARHRQLKKATDARDGSCRLTGSPISWCEAAHLFKESNPDQSLIAMLYSRRALYPGLESSVRTFREGCYDPKVAITLFSALHSSGLNQNQLAIYLAPKEGNADQAREIFALPLQDCAGDIYNKLNQPRVRRFCDAHREDEPLACLWDWLFASRMLARFGSTEAKEIAKTSPLVRSVSAWRQKVAETNRETHKRRRL